MAPDLDNINVAPLSPRLPRVSPHMSTNSSRRPSHTTNMPPPTSHIHSGSSSGMMTSADSQIPIRHPRPMTAAELHLQLEQEQEAVVNRLTRELSALRAQHSASVVSNASHSSVGSQQIHSIHPPDTSDSATHPVHSRQRRSSSNASSRSLGLETPSTAASSILGNASAPLGGVSQASADRAAALGGTLSRQPSVRSASGASTPARPSFDFSSGFHTVTLPHRPSLSNHSTVGSVASSSIATQPAHATATSNYADAAAAKAELDLVKEENETLRQRIRSLEQALRNRRRESQVSPTSEVGASRDRSLGRQSPMQAHATPVAGAGGLNITSWAAGTTVAPPRERSESQSTTASTRRAFGVEDRDDSIRVGESAASAAVNGRP